MEPRAPAVGCPSLVGASPSPGGFARSLSQSVSFPLFRGVPARVQRVRVVDRCRRFPSCRTIASYTSSYPDRCALAGARSHRPFCHACLTAATGDSAPSNPRVSAWLTSCSYGLESPDRKFSPALFPGGGRSQNLVRLKVKGGRLKITRRPSRVLPWCSGRCASATGPRPVVGPGR